jgi:hypothetical protein
MGKQEGTTSAEPWAESHRTNGNTCSGYQDKRINVDRLERLLAQVEKMQQQLGGT